MGTSKRWRWRGGGYKSCSSGAFWVAGNGREQQSGLLEQLTITGAEQTVITDLDEARWQDVLEEAADELLGRDGAALELRSGRLFVLKSDVAIFELAKAVVADSDAKDVRGEILEGALATADCLAVNYPVFFPDAPIDLSKQPGLFQRVTELAAEDHAERLFVDQKVFG